MDLLCVGTMVHLMCTNLFYRIRINKKFNSHKIFMYTSLQEKHIYMQRNVGSVLFSFAIFRRGKAQTTYLHYHFQAYCMKNRADMLKQRSWVTLVSNMNTQPLLDHPQTLASKESAAFRRQGKARRKIFWLPVLAYIVLATVQILLASQIVYIQWPGWSLLPPRSDCLSQFFTTSITRNISLHILIKFKPLGFPRFFALFSILFINAQEQLCHVSVISSICIFFIP